MTTGREAREILDDETFDLWVTLTSNNFHLTDAECVAAAERIITLTRWKAEALEVMDGWERVWEALGRPVAQPRLFGDTSHEGGQP